MREDDSAKGYLEILCEILPKGRDLGDDKLPAPRFLVENIGYPTRVPGDRTPGGYEVFLVAVTGIGRPGNTREHPNLEKG